VTQSNQSVNNFARKSISHIFRILSRQAKVYRWNDEYTKAIIECMRTVVSNTRCDHKAGLTKTRKTDANCATIVLMRFQDWGYVQCNVKSISNKKICWLIRHHSRPVTRGFSPPPQKNFPPPLEKCVGYSLKNLGPSQRTLRPSWCSKLVTGLHHSLCEPSYLKTDVQSLNHRKVIKTEPVNWFL